MLKRTKGTPARKRRKVIIGSLAAAVFAVGAGVAIPAFAAEEHCVGKDGGSGCVWVTPSGWDVTFGGWIADRPGDGLLTDLEIAFYSTGSTVGRAVRVQSDYRQVADNGPPQEFERTAENLSLPVTHIRVAVCNRELDEVPDCVRTDFIRV